MNLYFDTEFTGLHKDTTLISIGIVSEDGRKFYAESANYNENQCNGWIKENVLNNLFLNNDNIGVDYKERSVQVKGSEVTIFKYLQDWLAQFDEVQFVSDVCHYDFVLLIDLFGTAFDLPGNVCAACHDINQDIARYYSISERAAFDKSREEIVSELCGHEIEGRKHNALYDAEVIRVIYQEIGVK